MATFVSTCACRGRKPAGLIGRHHISRHHLITRLIQNRAQPRLLIAPTGYGKTSVAYEYCDLVFSFQHVYWVDCTSPCFLRDLDGNVLFTGFTQGEETAFLVVFEDVPQLKGLRSSAFVDLLDRLVAAGDEVIVTARPSQAGFQELIDDCLILAPSDFLLTEEEMIRGESGYGGVSQLALGNDEDGKSALFRGHYERQGAVSLREKGLEGPAADGGIQARVVCLCWSDSGAFTLLKGMMTEDYDDHDSLWMLAITLLGTGSFDDLEMAFGRTFQASTAARLSARYPHLGIDVENDRFACAPIEPMVLHSAWHNYCKEVLLENGIRAKDAAIASIVDLLLFAGKGERACELAVAFMTRNAGATWLAKRGWRLIEDGFPKAVYDAERVIAKRSFPHRGALRAIGCWAASIVADGRHAIALAQMAAFSSSTYPPDRALCAVLLVRTATAELRDRAADVLAKLLRDSQEAASDADAWTQGAPRPDDGAQSEGGRLQPDELGRFDWRITARIALDLREGPAVALANWRKLLQECEGERSPHSEDPHCIVGEGDEGPSCERSGATRSTGQAASSVRALLVTAAWIVEGALAKDARANGMEKEAAHPSPSFMKDRQWWLDLGVLADFVSHELERQAEEGVLQWSCARAAQALERMAEQERGHLAFDLPPYTSATLHHVMASLESQAAQARRERAERDRNSEEYLETHPNAFRDDRKHPHPNPYLTMAGTPTLSIKLFGNFEVMIGDELVDARHFSRQKTKTLLALLVLNRGSELSRERLTASLWPTSSPETARKNFYAQWSILTRALAVDGSCPYLIRDQFGCRMNQKLVVSDVSQFDEICHALLFRTDSLLDIGAVAEAISDRFCDDLMPSDQENEMIDAIRISCRIKLVDALLSGSARLLDAGEARAALWFAREALRHDRTREDVYVALMEAQIAADQRSAALETYFACRRYLADELGIDPSERIVALYESIIGRFA